MLLLIVNIFLGFAGFLLALYIAHKKRRKMEHFVCPLRGNCREVISSDYSKFFGIPVEYLGMMYYALIAIIYGLFVPFAQQMQLAIIPAFFLSTFALVFSFYLTFLQVFTLRKLCTWCLISAVLTALIFGISFYSFFDRLIPLIVEWHSVITILHILGMAIGLGTATVADLFFFKFLKDFHISEMEASVLKTFSQLIWLALGLIVMTGLGLMIPFSDVLLTSDQFVMKMLVVTVLVLNSSFLNLFVAPRFLQIQFGEHNHVPGELIRTRRLVFILGPISIVSWYVAFILIMLKDAPASFDVMWRVYVGLLIVAVLLGQITERLIDRKARTSTN